MEKGVFRFYYYLCIMDIEIYTLSHPVTKEVRYIGKAKNSKKRLAGHLRDSRRIKTPVYDWIKSLAKQNLTPVIEVIKIVPEIEWQKAEIDAIAEYRAKGIRLLNVALGGDEPYCSSEQRAINGRNVSKMIQSDPRRKEIWRIKLRMGQHLRDFKKWPDKSAYNKQVERILSLAKRFPEYCSCWANLSYL